MANLKRLSCYLLGMFCYACGACLATKAALGLTPVTSISYVLSIISNQSLGTVMLLYNVALILVERLIYGADFQRRIYLQLPLSIVFSVFIDLCMYLFDALAGSSLAISILLFAGALLLMGGGVAGMICGNFISLPAEGVVQAIAYRFHLDFGKTKLGHDCVIVLLTIVISLAVLGRVEGIQVGTVVAALCLGPLSKAAINLIEPWVKPREHQID